jgi:ribose transport system ATP-binding protein
MTTEPRPSTEETPDTGRDAAGSGAAGGGASLLRVADVFKRYGRTQALDGAELDVGRAEVVGLVGHNGAGKSTLMRVVVGITTPDRGRVEINGGPVANHYSPASSRAAGIRIVFQELSLCPTLRVFENILISHPQVGGRRWRSEARRRISDQLDEIFPGHDISPWARIDALTLAQRQMVEIAQATLGEDVRLVVLDEPTSALSPGACENLFRYIERQRERGTSFVLITHRMGEVLAHTDRVFVMRDGKVVDGRPSKELVEDDLVTLMGGTVLREAAEAVADAASGDRRPAVELDDFETGVLRGVSLVAHSGEVIGLAGLEGQGQQELLFELWRRRHRRERRSLRLRGRMAFVTGNRQDGGVFPLWSLALNVSVGSLRRLVRRGAVSRRAEQELARTWIERLAVRGAPDTPVLDLSGGTQQKVLIARALAAGADVILLDDPFRGVDISARQDTYRLIRDEAGRGRCFLWFSTENQELEQCDRVYVFRAGAVVAELVGDDITEEHIISTSFARTGARDAVEEGGAAA